MNSNRERFGISILISILAACGSSDSESTVTDSEALHRQGGGRSISQDAAASDSGNGVDAGNGMDAASRESPAGKTAPRAVADVQAMVILNPPSPSVISTNQVTDPSPTTI